MATTRLYFTNQANTYTPATIRGAWDATGTPVIRQLHTTKNGVSATVVKGDTVSTANYDVLYGRWVSEPLAADYTFTTSDTAEWILGVLEGALTQNLFFHVHIYVTQGDSDNIRDTALLTDAIGATEWPTTTAVGRGEGAKTLAACGALKGDRIVVVIGYRSTDGSTTASSGTLYYGATGGTDLVAENSSVTTNPGWIQFVTGTGLTFANIISVSEAITVAENITVTASEPPAVPSVDVNEAVTLVEYVNVFSPIPLWMAGAELGSTDEATVVGSGFSIDSTTYRSGAYAFRTNGSDFAFTEPFDLNVPQAYTRVYAQFASLPASANVFLQFVDGATGVATFMMNADGTVQMRNGSSTGTLLGTTTNAFSVDSLWHRIEVRVKADTGGAGIIELLVDGDTWGSFTGLTTTSANITGVVYGPRTVTQDIYWDDIVESATGYWGQGSIIARQAKTGAPTYDAWDKFGSDPYWADTPFDTTNYADSVGADSAQTKLISSFGSTQSGHGTETITTEKVNGAIAKIIGNEGGGQARVKYIRTRIGGADTDLQISMTGSDVVYQSGPIYGTISDINSMEVGGLKAGNNGGSEMTIRDVWVLVDYQLDESIVNRSVSDVVTITENITTSGSTIVNVFDGITTTEDIVISPVSSISVFDTTTVTEEVSLTQINTVSVFDTITISEPIEFETNSIISVFETIAVSEDVVLSIGSSINIFDVVTVSEDISVVVSEVGAATVNVFDTIAVTESITTSGSAIIDVNDAITIVDDITASVSTNDFDISGVFESIVVSETVVAYQSIGDISVIDTTTIVDVVVVTVPDIYLNVFDSVTITDYIALYINEFFVSIFDSANVTESTAISIVGGGGPDVNVDISGIRDDGNGIVIWS